MATSTRGFAVVSTLIVISWRTLRIILKVQDVLQIPEIKACSCPAVALAKADGRGEGGVAELR
jgi:hypothetical protein